MSVKAPFLSTVAAIALAVSGGVANATITTYSGVDDGAPVGGPFPLSDAAQASFLAAAGPVTTATFEGLPVGFYSPIAAAPGLSIALTGSDFGNGFSGVSNTTLGNLYGFNTTPGGGQFLGTSGDVTTLNSATPTHAVGTFMTGLQTVFTASLLITFTDTAPETLSVPIPVNGGAEYLGFTDTTAITNVTITDNSTTNGTDAWGIGSSRREQNKNT